MLCTVCTLTHHHHCVVRNFQKGIGVLGQFLSGLPSKLGFNWPNFFSHLSARQMHSCSTYPLFATLALVKSVGGLICGTDILSHKYAPSSGATPRCWHRNIIRYYIPIEATDLSSLLWNPRKRTTVPGVLSRINASPYQIKVDGVWYRTFPTRA